MFILLFLISEPFSIFASLFHEEKNEGIFSIDFENTSSLTCLEVKISPKSDKLPSLTSWYSPQKTGLQKHPINS